MSNRPLTETFRDSLNGRLSDFYSTYKSATIVHGDVSTAFPDTLELPENYTKKDLKDFLCLCEDISEDDVYFFDSFLITRNNTILPFLQDNRILDGIVYFAEDSY